MNGERCVDGDERRTTVGGGEEGRAKPSFDFMNVVFFLVSFYNKKITLDVLLHSIFILFLKK